MYHIPFKSDLSESPYVYHPVDLPASNDPFVVFKPNMSTVECKARRHQLEISYLIFLICRINACVENILSQLMPVPLFDPILPLFAASIH